MEKREELTVLSFGGGQDSTALLYKYIYDPEFKAKYAPGRFLVIMADTNDEHKHTLAHVESVKKLCVEHGIEFWHLTRDLGFHTKCWQGLREFYRSHNNIGSKSYVKSCTSNLKIQPIYRFLEKWVEKNYGFKAGLKAGLVKFAEVHGKIRVLIGISKGEEGRVSSDKSRPKWMRNSVQILYPLIDLGMDRAACQDYIRSTNNPVPFPSNCILCPFMSEIELVWLNRFHPADYEEWVVLEANKIAAWERKGLAPEENFGVWAHKRLPEVLAKAQVQYGHMSDAELNEYKFSHGHCVKSKY